MDAQRLQAELALDVGCVLPEQGCLVKGQLYSQHLHMRKDLISRPQSFLYMFVSLDSLSWAASQEEAGLPAIVHQEVDQMATEALSCGQLQFLHDKSPHDMTDFDPCRRAPAGHPRSSRREASIKPISIESIIGQH